MTTLDPRGLEAAANAIFELWKKQGLENCSSLEMAEAAITAYLASQPAQAVKALDELSGNTGELQDVVACAIRADGSDLCDSPWETLPDDMKHGWRGDADRAIQAVKDYLTAHGLQSALVAAPPPSGEVREALLAARAELEEYEQAATGETYNSPRLNAAIDSLASVPPADGWRTMDSAPKGEEVLIAYWRWRNSMSPGSIVVQSATLTEFHGPGIWSWVVSDNKHGPFPIRGWSDGDMLGWMPLPASPTGGR